MCDEIHNMLIGLFVIAFGTWASFDVQNQEMDRLNRALNPHPEAAEAAYLRAQAYFNNENYSAAFKAAAQVDALEPISNRARFIMMGSLVAQGFEKEGALVWKDYLAQVDAENGKSSTLFQPRITLVDEFLKAANKEESGDLINRLKELEVKEKETLFVSPDAWAYFKDGSPKQRFALTSAILGEIKGMVPFYSLALKADPTNSYAGYKLGKLLLRLGRKEEAIEAFKKARAKAKAPLVKKIDAELAQFDLHVKLHSL